jgi:hypothetical protein
MINPPARCKNSRFRDHISNEESMPSYRHLVYVLWCPLDKCIKYVGYTDGYPWTRLQLHMSDGRNVAITDNPKYLWLRRLHAAGLIPTMRLLKSFTQKADAYRFEAAMIAHIGAKRTLTNRSKGFPNWAPSAGRAQDETGRYTFSRATA